MQTKGFVIGQTTNEELHVWSFSDLLSKCGYFFPSYNYEHLELFGSALFNSNSELYLTESHRTNHSGVLSKKVCFSTSYCLFSSHNSRSFSIDPLFPFSHQPFVCLSIRMWCDIECRELRYLVKITTTNLQTSCYWPTSGIKLVQQTGYFEIMLSYLYYR